MGWLLDGSRALTVVAWPLTVVTTADVIVVSVVESDSVEAAKGVDAAVLGGSRVA